jgi:mitogen-activated protein kinase organizer 1
MSCALNAQLDVQPADNICKHLWYLKTTVTPQDSVTSVLVHGWEIIAGSVDGSVRRFDVRMGRMYVDELHQAVTCVAASHDGLCVLAACLDSGLRLLDKDSGQLLATYRGHAHESVKMECGLTPSDAHVVGCSETGA